MNTPSIDKDQETATNDTVTKTPEDLTAQPKLSRKYTLWGIVSLLLVTAVIVSFIYTWHHSKRTTSSKKNYVATSNINNTPIIKNAYEELQVLPYYNMYAQNNFQNSKGGIEYVNDIYDTSYTYSWLGTVSATTDTSVTITKQYTMGDKVQLPTYSDTSVTVPMGDFVAYNKTNLISQSSIKSGQIFAVWPQKFLQHREGDKAKPNEITKYFAITTDGYSIDQLSNSDPVNPQATAKGNTKDIVSIPSSLGLSDKCVNNTVDSCSFQIAQGSPGTGLYPLDSYASTYATPGAAAKTEAGNPSSVPFGEEVANGQSQPQDQLQRNVQGTVTSVTASNLVLKTSSGAQWTLSYTVSQRQEFTKLTGKSIKVGSVLGGIVLASINDLDNHTVDNAHVNQLSLL